MVKIIRAGMFIMEGNLREFTCESTFGTPTLWMKFVDNTEMTIPNIDPSITMRMKAFGLAKMKDAIINLSTKQIEINTPTK